MRGLRVLVLLAVFAAGFYTDRWLHRPIHIAQQLVIPADIEQQLMSLPAYDTVNEAAVHLAMRLYQCSHVYECAGVVAQRPDGRYSVSPVRSDEHGDNVEVNDSVPPGWKLVADVHTHPCLPVSHVPGMFSPTDVGSALMQRLPAYMVDLCTGEVHLFDPAKDVPNDMPIGQSGLYATKGRVVGRIPVDGLSVEPDIGR